MNFWRCIVPKTQGNLANDTGNNLERTVRDIFSRKGFEIVKYRTWIKNPKLYTDELLLENVPFETIYKHQGNTEFLIKSKKYDLEIRIECKWQEVAGSVDEKFPYLYLNCIEAMPESTIIIIVDGGGYKTGALQWLKEVSENNTYIKNNKHKDIKIFSLSEFMVWANRTFR